MSVFLARRLGLWIFSSALHLLSWCPCISLSVIIFREIPGTFWRWIKCFLLCVILNLTLHSFSLHLRLSIGYMWACLHDQRNAKSSPDHYNMPCVHNLHEIHIHSWHACTRNSFAPAQPLCFLWMCSAHNILQMTTLVSFMLFFYFSWSFLFCLLYFLFISPINALGSDHVV